jgi:hypothetical protein
MSGLLSELPLWSLYPLIVVLLLAAGGLGYYLAARRRRLDPSSSDHGVAPITAASLGLLALLLAFVVSFGVGVWHERRDLVVSEANAISTAYLRAGYLDEPYKTASRALLLDYANQRVAALDRGKLEAAKARSEEIHIELSAIVNDVVRSGNTAATTGLYVSAVGDIIDLHAERVTIGLYVRIPSLVLLLLLAIAVITLVLVGMQVGYIEHRSLIAPVLLVLVLSLVLYLIFDLDRSGEGLLKVPYTALRDLQTQLPTLP